jgi:RNA polymerase sigma factor (sigma-70 family)
VVAPLSFRAGRRGEVCTAGQKLIGNSNSAVLSPLLDLIAVLEKTCQRLSEWLSLSCTGAVLFERMFMAEAVFRPSRAFMETSTGLLERLRTSPEEGDWRRLDDLYRPLIRRWLLRDACLREEAEDLVQDVMSALTRELPKFERRRQGSFRAWLRVVTVNLVRAFWRDQQRKPRRMAGNAEQFLAALEDPNSELSHLWDQEHDRHVLDRLLEQVRRDFSPAAWSAFVRFAIDGVPAALVAQEAGISQNAVLLAKSRILQRLREEAAGLVGS